jgi:hypothetical protein
MIHVHPVQDADNREWNLASLVMVAAVLVAIGVFNIV